jgi:hypothetical protein
MRASLQALAVSGALIVAVGVAPAMGQSVPPADVSAPAAAAPLTGAAVTAPAANDGASAAAAPLTDASASAAAPAPALAPVSNADIRKAISQIRNASRSYAPCERVSRCSASFDSFGVALTFNDGTMAPFAHEQRLRQSGHDCIQNARGALQRGDRALAVQWVMAAHTDDPLTRNWLGDHPDAVLEALRRYGG